MLPRNGNTGPDPDNTQTKIDALQALRRLQGRVPKLGRGVTVTVTLPSRLAVWLDDMVEDKEFATRSHGIAYCIHKCREAGLPGKVHLRLKDDPA